MLAEEITRAIIGAAIEVHRALGPGLLESCYRECLVQELELRGLSVATEVPVSINYKGLQIECAYRLDLVVEHQVIVELKAVEALAPIHEAQLLTYLRLSGIRVGL